MAFAFGALRPCAAADSPEYGPVPEWVKPTAVPSAAQSNDLPVNVLLADQQVRLSPLGQEVFVENVVRVQTPQGLQGVGTLQLAWKPDTDILTIHKVRVIRGDQVIDLLEKGNRFTLLRRENHLEYSALDGVLTAAFQPTDLRVGDTLDLAYSVKRSDPVLAGTAEMMLGGWVQFPISRVSVTARWPLASQVRWRATDDVKPNEQRKGDYSELTYTLDNVVPPPQPTGAPRRFAVTRQIELSSFRSWSEVSKHLAPLYGRSAVISANSPLREEIARIKAATADASARAAAALGLVEDAIRYVYLGMNQGGLVPADADLTWSRRFGDCKAKSVLLIALLHELGVDAEPIAVSTQAGDGLDARLPMIGVFDHVIVRARIAGHVYWMDPTRTGDRRLANLKTPGYHWGLPLVSGGSDLITLLQEPLTEPISDTNVQIDARAGIHAPAPFQVAAVLSGDAAMLIKLQLANLSGATLDTALRQYWSQQYSFVDIKSVSAQYDPEAEKETLNMEGTARMGWKDGWYETDGLGVGYDAQFTRPAGADQSAPYAVPFPTYTHVRERILLPAHEPPFTVSGANVDRTIAGVEYRRQASISSVDGAFTGETSIRSVLPEFPAANSRSAQEALRAMSKDALYLRSPDGYVYTDDDMKADVQRPLNTAGEYIERGNRLINYNQYDLAITDFDKALELDPKSDAALAARGFAYLFAHQPQRAVEDWKAAEAINARNPVIFRGRGILAIQYEDYADGIAALTTSLHIDPSSTLAYRWRALAYSKQRQWKEAIADSTEVIRVAPDREMYRLRGIAYVRAGQIDSAIADAHMVSTLNGPSVQNYEAAAVIYFAARKRTDALEAYSKSLDLKPDVETYLRRGRIRPLSDLSGRRSDVDAALKLDSNSRKALVFRAEIQLQEGKYTDAVESATTAMAGHATPSLLIVRGAAYAKGGQRVSSDADIEAAKKLSADNPDSLNEFCWSLARYDLALDEALAACESAVAKAPDNIHYLDSQGFVLLRLGRYRDAIAAYDAALRLRPELELSLYGRGLAKLRIGDTASGQADLTAASVVGIDTAERFAVYGLKP